jgi:hypothetical protein
LYPVNIKVDTVVTTLGGAMIKERGGICAVGVGDRGDTILPMAYGGHSVYARKCLRAEAIKGIILPEYVRENRDQNFAWLEVLGVGPQVGKPCSKAHMHQFRRARCLSDVLQKGDLIMCPIRAEFGCGLQKSPLCGLDAGSQGPEYDPPEWFIEESIPLMIYRKEAA